MPWYCQNRDNFAPKSTLMASQLLLNKSKNPPNKQKIPHHSDQRLIVTMSARLKRSLSLPSSRASGIHSVQNTSSSQRLSSYSWARKVLTTQQGRGTSVDLTSEPRLGPAGAWNTLQVPSSSLPIPNRLTPEGLGDFTYLPGWVCNEEAYKYYKGFITSVWNSLIPTESF